MLGAIAGDIIGSIYESCPIKTVEFPLFGPYCTYTDDTVLTIAVADALLDDTHVYLDKRHLYIEKLHDWFTRYPDVGYGGKFYEWADAREYQPYGSWGNGAPMRVSAIGYAYDSLEETISEAKISAEVTHDHSEAVRGAQTIAAAIYSARKGASKAAIRILVSDRFGYDLSEPVDSLRERYAFDVSSEGTVPPALIAFLASDDFEHAVRLAVSLGGDSDTLACITGGVAEAYYGGVPSEIATQARAYLDQPLLDILDRFQQQFPWC